MITNIPVICVSAISLAQAYEKALVELHTKGMRFKTQYDKPGDPESIDATANITIFQPMQDPMIHKAFPGGIEDLREYVLELQGAKDHWVKNMDNKKDTKWEYTYHGRFKNWGSWKEKNKIVGPYKVDQIQEVINKLIAQPFTRQAQMITWMPHMDPGCYDPPCLQSVWCRIVEQKEEKAAMNTIPRKYVLNSNIRIRSNDAWGANFMNMFGFIWFLHDVIAKPITDITGIPCEVGRLNWQADSFHIYGKDIAEARARLFSRISSTAFKDRVYNFNDPTINAIYYEADKAIAEKIKKYDKEHGLNEKKKEKK